MARPGERSVVVDENDVIIGSKFRSELTHNDIYRVSALWVVNSVGDILLAQRAFNKKNSPGMWGPAVAGTNEEGETYLSNIVKEAEEEIGITGVTFALGPKRRVPDPDGFQDPNAWQYFCQIFTAVIDQPAESFTLEIENVAQVRWFTRTELERSLHEHPEQYLGSIAFMLRATA